MDRQAIISMEVDVVNLDQTLIAVEEMARSGEGSYVCVSNVHMCMEAFDSPDFKRIVNDADLVIPDGRPLSWAQKLLGYIDAEQVRGQDIMNAICAASGRKSLNIGLYGGSSDKLLKKVTLTLKQDHPDINITYSFSPPFRPLTEQEDQEVVRGISDADVDVLFVGIGCPKQERWMAEHKNSLKCVMLGVGAAYDFIAGSQQQAPHWMQKIGMEWGYRLLSEPKRLWKRYLKQNPRFIYYFLQQWLLKRKFK
ncbi:WecB/TagA/CpsF family glycosyltransferase [Bacterioplanoides sp.]|uniref:WecB/TagA/CpsF family glycosyltransferase n=1 Tax=Bacterioplanoides sp. TaxID=2066072 RepID=UPI003B5B213F